MIRAEFRSAPGLAEREPRRLPLVIKKAVMEVLELADMDMVEVMFGTFGPMDDPNGHDWTLDVQAHATEARIQRGDRPAQIVASKISALLDNTMGVVRISLAPMAAAYSHGVLGTTMRNTFD